MENIHPWSKYILSFLLILCTWVLGYRVEQSHFGEIFLFGTVFFTLYWYIFKNIFHQQTIFFFLGLSILLRLLLIFGVPNLSDDIYRFVWDGRLIINGINPFDHLPSYYIQSGVAIPGIDQSLYEQLNSPDYFTIYPPVCQGIFAFASYVFPQSIWGSSLLMKIIFVLFETGTIILLVKLLKHFRLPSKNVLLYALNPLIIIELTGNLHFEGPMLFFLCLSLWLIVNKRWRISAISMALAIASKLLPLIFLPFLIRRLGWKKSVSYFAVTGFSLLAMFTPMFNSVFFSNFGDSLNLYFQKFEFNASIYYLLRYVGYKTIGYNLIQYLGPVLASITCLSILMLAWREKSKQWITLPVMMLFSISIYLLLSTTVHPWYTSLPLLLCVFTSFRYPVLWSGLIWLTYTNYSYPSYYENLGMVGIEYIAVGVLFATEFYNHFYSKRPEFINR